MLALFARAMGKNNKGDSQGAIEDADRAIALDPAGEQAWLVRGWARLTRKEYALSIDDETRAIALNPRDHLAVQIRGEARKALGDRAGALADLERYLEMAPPGDPSLPGIRATVEELRRGD
ncbi:tetratricopeptide repeat protein [bacterium]|nr:tetratricopeptide repeat protein [bacterium]